MQEFYAKRNGLLKDNASLSYEDMRTYFCKTYSYFREKGYFIAAELGIKRTTNKWSGETELLCPLTLETSPEVYFFQHTNSANIYPIHQYYEIYSDAELFTVIEILYHHIGVFNEQTQLIENKLQKDEYAEHINGLLRFYGEGFYLEPTNGFIMRLPNEALRQQLSSNSQEVPTGIYEQLVSASKAFYHYDADMETKKKSICTLADILEKVRNDLKERFSAEYGVSKNEHDKLIFGIVNGFEFRHNNAEQKTDYSKNIWYDWMMQYYTSVVIAYYKLLAESTATDIDF
ncbi:hypothetical protein AGMMS49975_22680 [Clostridia bacterium]|nr:hypothetical protein AGMMS49975_22680 [Clostridia bacterium]